MEDSTTTGTRIRSRGRSGGVVVPRAVTEWDALDAYDFRLAVWLSTHEESFGERISQREMSRRLNMSQDRIAKSLAVLEGLDLVEVERRGERVASEVVFDHDTWNAHLLATRAASARHTGSDCSPGEHKENTVERTQKQTARAFVDSAFVAFWNVYPKKTAKRTALLAYERAVQRVTAIDALNDRGHATWKIQTAAEAYAKITKSTEYRFVKAPTTWLNGDCWEDEVAIGGNLGRAMTQEEEIEHDRRKLLAEYNSVKEF